VYAGVKIDYKGKHVTPENFVAVLLGDERGVKGGTGRVLKR
jgi:legumain